MRSLVLLLCFLAIGLSGCSTGPVLSDEDSRASLTGTITYLQRIALSPDSVVTVRLDDISRQDAPARTLARTSITTKGRQVPIPFTLAFDADRIQPDHRYVVRAEIHEDEQLRWTTDTATPVLTQGAAKDDVAVRVTPMAGATAEPQTDDLVGPTWHLVQIDTPDDGTAVPPADEPNTLVFNADGRVTGQADCNRIFGNYEMSGDGELTFEGLGATLAACPPPSSSDAFLRLLGTVESYALTADRLHLTAADGRALELAKQQDSTSSATPMIPQPVARTLVFRCAPTRGERFQFTTRTGPGEIAIWLPERFGERYLVLGQTRAASGARYKGDGVVFWNKGNEALLVVDGHRFRGCTIDSGLAPWEDARIRGVDFRAIGQEPGWSLEIARGARLRFVHDYGRKTVETPAPEPTVGRDTGRTVYRVSTQTDKLTVTIIDQPCTDVMSGASYDNRVIVNLDDQTYRGCGRSL